MVKKIRLFLCFLSIPTGLHSLEISGFNAVQNSGKSVCSAEFSKIIKIENIECSSGSVVLPEEKKKDKIFRDIKLLSKKIYLALENCCNKKSCGLSAEKKIPALKIHSITGLFSPYRIANVSVVFDDDILVVFGVVKSKAKIGDLWVSYPENFEILDSRFKKQVNATILREFLKWQK